MPQQQHRGFIRHHFMNETRVLFRPTGFGRPEVVPKVPRRRRHFPRLPYVRGKLSFPIVGKLVLELIPQRLARRFSERLLGRGLLVGLSWRRVRSGRWGQRTCGLRR